VFLVYRLLVRSRSVHLSDRDLSTQSTLNSGHPARSRRIGQMLYERPRTRRRTFNLLVRAETTPLLVLSFALGAILAWWETGTFDGLSLGFGLLGAICAGWAFNAFGEYCSDRYNRTPEAKAVQDPLYTGFGMIRRGMVSRNMVRDIVLLLLTIFSVCILWLTFLAGWPILYFAVLGFMAGGAVLLLPFIPGYRSWGFGQLGTMLVLGVLPLLSGFYGQAHALSSASLWSAVMFALIFGLVQYDYDAINIRRDWLIGKPTLAVNLGPARVRDVSTLFTVGIYLAALAVITLTDVPLMALIALIALPVALSALEPLQHDEVTSDDSILLYSSALMSSSLAGLLFCAALIIEMIIQA
jgi:1,4-dihydroxy-2-naphthoate octaprenyltransferase